MLGGERKIEEAGYCMITTEAYPNDVAAIHDRMPLQLARPQDIELWLDDNSWSPQHARLLERTLYSQHLVKGRRYQPPELEFIPLNPIEAERDQKIIQKIAVKKSTPSSSEKDSDAETDDENRIVEVSTPVKRNFGLDNFFPINKHSKINIK